MQMLKNFKIRIVSLLISVMLILGASLPVFASSVTPSNLTPYLQSNSGYYWINPNTGYSSTVSSGTKLVDMIGQLGGNLSQGVYNIFSKLSNTVRIYLYNYSGTNTSFNSGSSLGDLVGYGFQYLTQTNGLIYDKVDDLLTGVNSIKGYVDGVETGLTSVNSNLTTIKSDTNSIKGYIDGLEQGQADIVDAVEGINIPSTDLTTVESYLNTINSNVLSNEGHNNQIYNLLSDEFNSSLPASLVSRISSINGNLGDIRDDLGYSSSSSNLSDDIESVINVGSDIVSNVADVYSVNSTISAINNDILAINTTMSAIQTTIAGINQGIYSDTTDLNTKLQTLTDNYNNIDWVSSNLSISGYKKSITGDYITSNSNSSDWYIRLGNFRPNDNIYKITIPMYLWTTDDININASVGYNRYNNFVKISDAIISYNVNQYHADIIFSIPTSFALSTSETYININADKNILYINPTSSYTSFELNSTQNDYFEIFGYMFNRNVLDLLRDAKFVFFDDETIAAKKADAEKTTAAINQFTGSGGAAASVSDFGDVASGLDSLSDGFTGGASASAAFGVMDGNSDGWAWFSSETQNDMDNTGSNNRLLRSLPDRQSSTPYLDSYYSDLANMFGIDIGE